MTTENSTYTDNLPQEKPCEDNLNAACEVAAEAAEAEDKALKTASATGKFKSVEALMEAYLNLEAEFTRRSQRLKELEESKAVERPSSAAIDDSEVLKRALSDERIKSAVVGEYLKQICASRSVPLATGGVACAAPVTSPKSVREAGELAKQFLKG